MRVAIRVDADARIGSGHFMRMIALAQMLRDAGHDATFVTAGRNPMCDAYLSDEALPVHEIPAGVDAAGDARTLIGVATETRASWVVLDGASFDEPYQRAVREAGFHLLSVDDYARGHFVSDVVLNQNYGSERLTYSTAPYTTRLAGIRYVLLRREFRATPPPARDPRKRPLNVLVTLGGAQQRGLLSRTLDAVLTGGGDDVTVTLLIGAFQALEPDVEAVCARAAARVSVVRHNRRMAETMAAADVAVAGAGSTMWELLCMRVPFLAIPLDPAHEPFVERLVQDGLCAGAPLAHDLPAPRLVDLARGFLHDDVLRATILERTAGLVDPRRAWRELSAVMR
jgi:UDP-2,4-diacetamido-2,4,6-trideoxy-beta-L-altropyranose hydrolase